MGPFIGDLRPEVCSGSSEFHQFLENVVLLNSAKVGMVNVENISSKEHFLRFGGLSTSGKMDTHNATYGMQRQNSHTHHPLSG